MVSFRTHLRAICTTVLLSLSLVHCSCGSDKVIEAPPPNLVLSSGPKNPVDGVEAPGASGVPVLQLTVTGDPNHPATLTGLTVTADGDIDQIASVRLLKDVNANGFPELSDTAYGEPQPLSENRTATFAGIDEVMEPNASLVLLVVV
ncbi:MAG: hypothetical protein ACK4N5_12475, partial [Myxococcales bacterium]